MSRPKFLQIAVLSSWLILAGVFSVSQPVLAGPPTAIGGTSTEGNLDKGLVSNLSGQCLRDGTCTVCDFVQVFINVGNLILMVFGGVALVFVMWNLFGMMQSRGAEEKIRAAKEGLWHTFGGVVFTLLAWQIVAILTGYLMGRSPLQNACNGGGVDVGGGTALKNFMEKVGSINVKNFQGAVSAAAALFPPVIGAVVFLNFVVNGVKWVTAAGNDEKIKEGQKGMLYAALALLMFFGAYIMLKFVIEGLTKGRESAALFAPLDAFALTALNNPLTNAETSLDPPGELYGRVAYWFVRFMGVGYLIMTTYAGFLWLSSSGSSEKIEQSKSILIWSTLGIIAILGAYAVTAFLLKGLNPGLLTPV